MRNARDPHTISEKKGEHSRAFPAVVDLSQAFHEPGSFFMSIIRFGHRVAGLGTNPVLPGTSWCGEGFGDSAELRDYRARVPLSAVPLEASVGDTSAAKVDPDETEAQAGSKNGFDCLN